MCNNKRFNIKDYFNEFINFKYKNCFEFFYNFKNKEINKKFLDLSINKYKTSRITKLLLIIWVKTNYKKYIILLKNTKIAIFIEEKNF